MMKSVHVVYVVVALINRIMPHDIRPTSPFTIFYIVNRVYEMRTEKRKEKNLNGCPVSPDSVYLVLDFGCLLAPCYVRGSDVFM